MSSLLSLTIEAMPLGPESLSVVEADRMNRVLYVPFENHKLPRD